MKRILMPLSLFVAFLMVFGLIGCGDDSATGNKNLNEDNTNFEVVDDAIGDDYFSSAFQSIDISFALLDSIPSPVLSSSKEGFSSYAAADDVAITSVSHYEYSEGWHIFQFSASIVDPLQQSSVTIEGVDSIQVVEDGLPVQYPQGEEFIDVLNARAHVDWESSTEGHGAVNHALSIEFLRTDTDTTFTISGSANDTVFASFAGDGSNCSLDLALNQSYNNVVISSNGDQCPLDGTAILSGSLDLVCVDTAGIGSSVDSVEVSAEWSITTEVNDNGSLTVTYSDNTTFWTVTEPCVEPPVAASRWWLR